MRVTFWGVRGSIARSDATMLRYGGNTACIEVVSDGGERVIVDCGTGAFSLGRKLLKDKVGATGSILISHTHWDHIQGLPFFAPLFVPGGEWNIYGPRGLNHSLRETLSGQMQYEYFPITIEAMGAAIHYHELVEGAFEIGDIRVAAQYLDHPALTLGYRFEADGVAVVYACDHECSARVAVPGDVALRGSERRHVEFLMDADLVIHDAQFTAEEYPGRVGWGHSTPDYALAVCREAGAKRLALTHHDPLRRDDALDEIVAALRATARPDDPDIRAAREGDTLALSAPERAAAGRGRETGAVAALTNALAGQTVAFGPMRPEIETVLREACAAEDLPVTAGARGEGAAGPSLVVVDADARGGGLAAVEAERAKAGDATVIAVSSGAGATDDATDGSVEWMVWPFSRQYAQTRLRAAVLRRRARWVRAPAPRNEEQRIAALHGLRLLDTPPDERFDRITRMAASAFDTPVALVSFIDTERQWMKSCVGVELDETPREIAFCAHTILDEEIMVVSDARADRRFADNPVVAGPPGVRFYAGCPLRAPNGAVVGSLCVIDTKPRSLSERQLSLFRDFARMTEREIEIAAKREAAA